MIVNINFAQRKKIQDMTVDIMDDDSDDDVKSVNKLIASLKVCILIIMIDTFFPHFVNAFHYINDILHNCII
jgi:hypothetical protein